MSENLAQKIALQRSKNLYVESYHIQIDVREAQTGNDTFPVTSIINYTQQENAVYHVDYLGAEVTGVWLDGVAQDFTFNAGEIILGEIVSGAHQLKITGKSRYSTSGEGLHRFVDPVDQEVYLYSQFEPADAQRVFPNFEQPDLKAEFHISITAPQTWVTLSNGAEVSSEEAAPNSAGIACLTRHFAPTKRLSTYLTAFIAGAYVGVHDEYESELGVIPLGYYCRASLADYLEFTDINTVTKQGLKLFPEAFNFPYPWGKYDSVFVPEYNLGAMENPGCVTFNEDAYIHRGASTRSQRAKRANTILHEMSHMWFGDLVTPKWWDDLWLKESFAEFMGAWGCVKATQYTEAWQDFNASRFAWALQHDQYPTTHPIAAEIPDLAMADQAFDGITYAKGAAVLRQLVYWVGEEVFFQGAAQFFQKFAFSNACFQDLLTVLAEVSGKDLSHWAAQWLQTAGVSTLQCRREIDGITLSQVGIEPLSGLQIRRPHKIKVTTWKIEERQLIQQSEVWVELTDKVKLTWQELGAVDPDCILPNDGALSYLKIDFDDKSRQALLHYEMADLAGSAVVSNALWQEVRDGRLAVAKYIDYVFINPHINASGLLQSRALNCVRALRSYLPRANQASSAQQFVERAFQVWQEATKDSDQYLIWAGAIAQAGALTTQSADILQQIFAKLTDQDLRWSFIASLAALGELADTALEAEYQKTGTASDEVAYRFAKASLAGSRAHTVQILLGQLENVSNNQLQALLDGFNQPLHSAEAKTSLGDYFAIVNQLWQAHSQEIAERLLYSLYPGAEISQILPDTANSSEVVGDKDQLKLDKHPVVQAAVQWLDNNPNDLALRKIILDCTDDAKRSLRAQLQNLPCEK